MTDYKVGVLKATENYRVVDKQYGEDRIENNFPLYEGVLAIDGQIHRWKAYSVRSGEDPPQKSAQVYYRVAIRVDLAEWRKRQDADAIRTEIIEAITAERKRLNKEEQSQ